MPSIKHETLVQLFRDEPEFAVRLLSSLLGIELPAFVDARSAPADHVDLTPVESRADNVVVLTGPDGKPVQAVIVEAQLSRNPAKRRAWPGYVINLGAQLDCPTVLLVVCIDAGVARWCRTPIESGHPGYVLVPLVIGPSEIPVPTSPEDTPAEFAVLAAMAHGGARHEVLDVLVASLATVEPDRAILYARLVLAALPEAARHHLEELMSIDTFEYQSDWTRSLVEKGRVEAKAADVLTVLDARGLAVPAALRERIEACHDLDRLDTWLRSAAVVASADDLDA